MKSLKFFTAAIIIASLFSCKPKPLTIEVKQAPPAITLSSATPDDHTVIVSAGYSVNSLVKLTDTVSGAVKIPKEMLLKEGVLTLTRSNGTKDTLFPVSDGLYANANIPMTQGESYTIDVYERDKGHVAMATTTYQSKPMAVFGRPQLSRKANDTTVSISVQLNNVQVGDYYFISYNTTANARKQSPTANMDISTLASFTPKQLALLAGKNSHEGKMEKEITLNVKTTDTLLMQVAKVDRAYFDYLTAYKRSGSLINQITGEPINMPTNIIKGFGFFSLFAAERKVFYMREY